MKKSNKFSPEVRERALRMVQEHRGEYPSLWAAIESIAPKRTFGDNPYAERFECLKEERLARCIVADSEFDVVKHEFS
jgi:hypothetical protein